MSDAVLRLVQLPCSPKELEDALLHAAHEGHWQDCEVRLESGKLVLVHPKE